MPLPILVDMLVATDSIEVTGIVQYNRRLRVSLGAFAFGGQSNVFDERCIRHIIEVSGKRCSSISKPRAMLGALAFVVDHPMRRKLPKTRSRLAAPVPEVLRVSGNRDATARTRSVRAKSIGSSKPSGHENRGADGLGSVPSVADYPSPITLPVFSVVRANGGGGVQ